MKYILCLLMLVLTQSYGQRAVKQKKYHELGAVERSKKYPFDKAVKIALISFNVNYDGALTVTPVNADGPQPKQVPVVELSEIVNKDSLVGITQFKIITAPDINKLTDILYNTCRKYVIDGHSTLGCYNPRNAILFYDRNDRVFEYIEICFECRKVETKPTPLNELNDFCSYGLFELKDFFTSLGLETTFIDDKR